MRTIAAILVAASVSACAVTTTDSPTSADDPFPANYRELIKANVGEIFIDPGSVRDASISTPKIYDTGMGPVLTSSTHEFVRRPWMVCVRANAKNRMGGYTGMSALGVLIKNGKIIDVKGGPSPYGDTGTMWCKDHHDYAPFPEINAARS